MRSACRREDICRSRRFLVHRRYLRTGQHALLKDQQTSAESSSPADPRFDKFGRVIEDDYAALRSNYRAPKNPIVLAHGLFGFDQLHLAGPNLPGIHYWRGITESLAAEGVEVFTTSVPPSGTIEARAEKLGNAIEEQAQGKAVNIIAHSMGGLDSRYMISRTRQRDIKVLSLTTIATPHHGSEFADYLMKQIRPQQHQIYKLLESFGIETGAFTQLTRGFMKESFNPQTPNVEQVRYFSYGASFQPSILSIFRRSHRIINRAEGPNDGLVSVSSSRWGEYQGTIMDVSHLDLINWTNRLRWFIWQLTGNKRNFNAVAFYLAIADMLAHEGL